jgi:hypothetical protein
MRSDYPQTHGLSGDLGWNEAEDAPTHGVRSSLLLVATSVYFGSIWLLSGLPPLPFLTTRGRSGRTPPTFRSSNPT